MTKDEIEKLAEAHVIEVGIEYERDKNKIPTLHDSFKAGYLKGVDSERKRFIDIIDKYLSYYPVDLFRPFKDVSIENPSIDRISAQMARHICILFKKEINEGNDDN